MFEMDEYNSQTHWKDALAITILHLSRRYIL
jgi:hypothetical protein